MSRSGEAAAADSPGRSGPRKSHGGGSEIFPLPTARLEGPARAGLSRGCRQQVARRHAVLKRSNEIIEALNHLSGSEASVPVLSSQARDSVLHDIVNRVVEDPPDKSDPDPKAAWQALLGHRSSPYEEEPCREVAYSLEKLSLPERAGQCALSDCLTGNDFLDLSRFEERLMLTQSELKARIGQEGKARSHWSEELMNDDSAYCEFIRALHARDMLYYSFGSSDTVGIFVVEKKSGRLRLIVDCRRLNQRLRKPPRTPLASAGALGEVCLDKGEEMRYSSHDIADCFYQFRIPKSLSRYLGLRPIRAGDVGVRYVEGVEISPQCFITPFWPFCRWASHTPFIGPSRPI